ncbi:dnaJ homolog subfamily C member 4 isoform X6 [Nannospalax galili]|uniref:dnaJ homolog subfamily C member 4 isoform X6 n=1 Tax=Nannospalax galili TaxID=1026970 RepID=UPI00111C1C3D|nr:dnaJ homolog subfamily C member 4 isoform X6 [Nannospalax galili]
MHPSRGSLFPSCPPAIINVTPVAPAASAPLQAMAPQPSLQVSHCRRRAAVWASLCRSGPSNYYELLGVHPGSSAEEIKRAFFAKSKELHPDRDPGNPALHSRFVELNEAYRVLSREQSRRNYDYRLRSASPPKSPGTTTQHKSARHTYRKLEQVHRSFMDEKDRIITAIYNDTRARARANRARIQQERRQRQQPGAPSLPPEGPRMVPRDNSP